MKILLDENIPTKVKFDFGEPFEIYTVRDMKWLGKKNGELLRLMDVKKFDFFVTSDRKLKDQQNLPQFNVNVILLNVPNNKHQTIQPCVEKIKLLLKKNKSQRFIEIL